jgi:hypothetical protein
VDKFFKTLAKLASSSIFSFAKSENYCQKYRKGRERGTKKLARLASRFVFLLANPEFYSQLASWRVVIRTPAYMLLQENVVLQLKPMKRESCKNSQY